MSFWETTDIYILEDGDGDPEFMHVRHEVRFADEPWFTDSVYGQPASLFVVLGPQHQGRYVALTSRWTESIEEQLLEFGIASVAVNLVENATSTFGQDQTRDLRGVGMTVLRRPDDSRFR